MARSPLPDELLERSFQLTREVLRLAKPYKGLAALHGEGSLLLVLFREAEELVRLLAEERLARCNSAGGYRHGLDIAKGLFHVRTVRGGA